MAGNVWVLAYRDQLVQQRLALHEIAVKPLTAKRLVITEEEEQAMTQRSPPK